MKRYLSIIVYICLGAVAVAIGMGLYLKKANDDRERLAAITRQAQEELQRVKDEGRSAVDEANRRIAAADVEIAKTQATMKRIEEERVLLASATSLLMPSSKTLKGWKDVVDLALGISVKIPPGSHADTTDAQSLTVITDATNVLPASDTRWLSITPYDIRLEQELTSAMNTSTPVSYTVKGRLLIGQRGTIPNKTGTYTVLQVRMDGTSSHLIWLKEPFPSTTRVTGLDVLATLDFNH